VDTDAKIARNEDALWVDMIVHETMGEEAVVETFVTMQSVCSTPGSIPRWLKYQILNAETVCSTAK
jgi:hypothetical protein